MRIPTRRLAALSIVATLTLAGCGSSDSDGESATDSKTSSSSSEAPDAADVADLTGDAISADGFSFKTPDGWKDSQKSLPSALAVAINSTDADGFSDNVNVIADNTVAGVDQDDLEAAVEKVLNSVNAQDIKVKDPVEIDGEDAVHVGAIFEQNGTKYRTEQYAVSHDDKGYVVTFSFSEDVPDADRDSLASSILASWTWS